MNDRNGKRGTNTANKLRLLIKTGLGFVNSVYTAAI